jgi:hypothetical protein
MVARLTGGAEESWLPDTHPEGEEEIVELARQESSG